MVPRTCALGLLALLLIGCGHGSSDPAASAVPARSGSGEIYTGPMHPEYRSTRPGSCPICNMQLVPLGEVATESPAGEVAGRSSAAIPAELQKRIGLATSAVERAPFAR